MERVIASRPYTTKHFYPELKNSIPSAEKDIGWFWKLRGDESVF